jgi:hypothetical protein
MSSKTSLTLPLHHLVLCQAHLVQVLQQQLEWSQQQALALQAAWA